MTTSSATASSPPRGRSSASPARGVSPPSRDEGMSPPLSLPCGSSSSAAVPATSQHQSAAGFGVPPLLLSQLRETQHQASEAGLLLPRQDLSLPRQDTVEGSDKMTPDMKSNVTQGISSRSFHRDEGFSRRGSEGIALPQYSLRATADGGVTLSPRCVKTGQ